MPFVPPICTMGGVIASTNYMMQQARKRREAEEKKRQEAEARHTCSKDIPCENCVPGCHLKEE